MMSATTPSAKVLSQMIALTAIRTEEGCQARMAIRQSVVHGYARAMIQQQSEGGLRFPAIVLFTDGSEYWLGDGYHRVLAAREAGLTELLAEIHPGTQREALLYAISANSEHGLPRTNADKRKAVALLLNDPEWSQWTDREIARRCQVDHRFVGRLRHDLCGDGPSLFHTFPADLGRLARIGDHPNSRRMGRPTCQRSDENDRALGQG